MAQAEKQTDQATLTRNLRDRRRADEAARRAAGTWGDLSVGEVTHRASGSVYIQVWKGAKRPEITAATARAAGVPAEDWPAIESWLKAVNPADLHHSIVAWTVSKAEAARLKAKRMVENSAAGVLVINPAPGKG